MNKQITNTDAPATRKDVEEIVSVVVGEALKVIGIHFEAMKTETQDRFDTLGRRFDTTDEQLGSIAEHLDTLSQNIEDVQSDAAALRTDLSQIRYSQARLESKLDTSINQQNSLSFTVRDHDRKLNKLRPKVA